MRYDRIKLETTHIIVRIVEYMKNDAPGAGDGSVVVYVFIIHNHIRNPNPGSGITLHESLLSSEVIHHPHQV